MRSYVMEMDTTELFNSSLKTTQTIASVGGVIEFNSTIPFTDSTVYYWRVHRCQQAVLITGILQALCICPMQVLVIINRIYISI